MYVCVSILVCMNAYMHVCVCVCGANKLEIHAKYHITPVVHIISFVFLRSVTDIHGSVRTVTRPPAERLRNRGSIPGRVKILFSLQSSYQLWRLYDLSSGCWKSNFALGVRAWARSSTHTSILCHRLITRGPIPPLRHTSLWYGAQWQSVSFHNSARVLHALCRYAGLLHSASLCDNVLATKSITDLIYMNRTVSCSWMTPFSLPFLRGSVWLVQRNRPSRVSE